MPLHDMAWRGLDICILSELAIIPMRMEQSISIAIPSLELSVSSFQTYEEIYEQCKSRKASCLLILSETFKGLSGFSIFRELNALIEATGGTCYGVLTYQTAENPLTAKNVGKNSKLLDYLPQESLLSPDAAVLTMSELWKQFHSRFEADNIPEPLAAALLSFYSSYCGDDSEQFILRTSMLLGSQLNITWLESIGIKWEPFISFIQGKEPALLSPLQRLVRICQSTSPPEFDTVEKLTLFCAELKNSTAAKIVACVHFLDQKRKNGNLEEEIAKFSSPQIGGPALPRLILKRTKDILTFAHEASAMLKTKKAI